MSKFPLEKSKLLKDFHPELGELLCITGGWLAGGSVTSVFSNKEISDFDIYVPDISAAVQVLAWCWGDEDLCLVDTEVFRGRIVSVTERSVTFRVGSCETLYQLILFDNPASPEEIFEKFDFTCCMGAYCFKEKDFILHEDFLRHIAQRQLVFNEGTTYPFVSALRVHKYRDKGYDIPRTQFIKILLTCANKPIQTWEEFISQIAGLYGDIDGDCFDKEKEFSLGEAISQIDSASVVAKLNNIATDDRGFDSLEKCLAHVSSGITIGGGNKDEPVYDPKFYYKRVTSNLSSHYKPSFKYEVGKTVDGGVYGIYADYDVKDPKFRDLTTVLELEALEDSTIIEDTGFLKSEYRILGPVLVRRSFKHRMPSDMEYWDYWFDYFEPKRKELGKLELE